MKNRVLVIEDEESVRFALQNFLRIKGYEVIEAENCAQARGMFLDAQPDVVVIDYLMEDGNALDVLPYFKEADPETPVVVLTAHGSIELAVRAIKEGAEQFLTKPIELPALLVILQRLLENRRIRQKQLAETSRQIRNVAEPFLGNSRLICELRDQIKKILPAESPVLIQGETGTGKSVLARWMHDNGPRAGEAFVDLNCAGLSREFLETELFGHQKGAFTGAAANKIGLFEVAHRGTVFLDEIGDLDQQVQPKLLKVLEEKRFRRMGDVRDRLVDIRLIAASNQSLETLVEEKKFRSDLYFRINTIVLVIPPLRERKEDVPIIAQRLLKTVASDMGRSDAKILPDAFKLLQSYSWPGNIRELRNILERALLLSENNTVGCNELRLNVSSKNGLARDSKSNLNLTDIERECILEALRQEEWNVDRASKRLGIPKSSLYYKIKAHGIESKF